MFRILSIDPGKENVGISIWDLNESNLKVKSIKGLTEYFTQDNITLKKVNDDVFMGLAIELTEFFFDVLCEHKPDCLIAEEPFIRMLTMHGSLTVVKALNCLDVAVGRYNKEVLHQKLTSPYRLKSIRINPRVAKLIFTGDGNAKKPDMLASYLKHNNKHLVKTDIDEHAVDAFAFAHVLHKELLRDNMFNYPLCPVVKEQHPIDKNIEEHKKRQHL